MYSAVSVVILTNYLLMVAEHKVMSGNVGTVLFTTADNLRKCWSEEEVATLTSRMFFEDILPCDSGFNIQDENFILSLIDYFQMVAQRVKSAADGKTGHILLRSLSDCLGERLVKLFLIQVQILPHSTHYLYNL